MRCLAGDWYEALPAQDRYDLIVSNPPYIAREDAHLAQGDLRFEPRGALTDENDGLAALARIAGGAPGRLLPGGAIWMEHGWDQAEAARALLRQAGLREVHSRRDLAGIERISGGYL
ncbi:heme biosynthesis protein [Bordetella pertussis]|nr:heme biosynthesis protein [Bordetella pertussis]CPQ25067.1 heme biosynthesis protein [Bordetella pertussis]CPQ36630.1 heme biosynthesis protein [Bordetella pertussis]